MITYLAIFILTAAHAATPRIPLRFEPDAGKGFIARGGGHSVQFDAAGVTVPGGARIGFGNANRNVRLSLQEAMPGVSNYLNGRKSSAWRTNVPQFGRLRYHDLYDGIDLVFYGTENQLEYDFVVAPGADPRRIELQFDGAQPVLNAMGDLVLRGGPVDIVHRKPVLYQERDGARVPISGRYELRNGNRAGFVTAAYDHSNTLTIDPVMTYSTYLGGAAPNSADDIAYATTRDAQGNIYITGRTASTNFPLQGAMQTTNKGSGDAFVAKFDPTGEKLQYATYIGGGSLEYSYAIAVDSQGQVHIAGQTGSRDFPVKNAFQQSVAGLNNAFLMKLNTQGNNIMFSTIFGGERNDVIYALALDEFGNVYAGGGTNSEKFPTRNPQQARMGLNGDAFAAKFSPTGELFYSTFVGGTGAEAIYAVAVDSLGNLVLAGATNSLNLATADVLGPKGMGGRDAFVAKLNASGSAYVFFTYLGGRQGDEARAVTLDGAGNIYVAGNTFSTDFPVTEGVLQPKLAAWGDGFIAKMNDSGTTLNWSTYLGGSGKSAVVEDEVVNAISVDADGFVYLAGTTTSADLPVNRAVQPQFGGGTDAFLAKLTPDGSALVFSTFLGGAADEVGLGLVVTPLRAAYIAGQSYSTDYPLTAAPLSNKRGANSDAFLTAVCDPVLFASAGSLDFYFTKGSTTAVAAQKLEVNACAKLPLNVAVSQDGWLAVDPADSTMPSAITVAVKPDTLDPGDYTATLTVYTPDSWFAPLSITVRLHVSPPPESNIE